MDRKVPERERPKLSAVVPFIDEILEADRKAAAQAASHRDRIWMRLRRELPAVEVAESTVRSYVRQRKIAMGLAGHEVFVPQSYEFGGEAQVDWYEGWAEFDGSPARRTSSACARWPRAERFTGPIRTPHSRRF